MTCGEFKQWLATQPDDKQIAFTMVEPDGTVQHLAVAEAYPAAHNYYVELEPIVTDACTCGRVARIDCPIHGDAVREVVRHA